MKTMYCYKYGPTAEHGELPDGWTARMLLFTDIPGVTISVITGDVDDDTQEIKLPAGYSLVGPLSSSRLADIFPTE